MVAHSLDSFLSLNIVGITNDRSSSLVSVTNFALAETIQLLSRDSVAIDGEETGDGETSQWDTHGLVVVAIIGCQTRQGWEQSATANGGNDPRGSSLGVSSKTSNREGEDGRENARLEEKDDCKHGETSFAPDTDSCGLEDHNAKHENGENISWLDEHEHASSSESTNGKESLANSVSVRASGL